MLNIIKTVGLVILLIFPIRNSYAQYSNYCYCTTSWRQGTVYGSVCTANADCWACAPGAYNTTWQQAFCPNYQAPVVTCQTETQTQTLSCPVHYSGSITQTKTKTCTTSGTGIWGEWQTTSNTCVQNPPTCQVSSQTQTISCPTGYTGSITQTRSLTCPDPYGSPVVQPWVTTSDTCKKSATNPTNPVSPVNPASPTAVVPSTQTQTTTTSSTSVPTTLSSPATVETQTTAPNSETTQTSSQTSTATSDAPTATGSVTQPSVQGSAKETGSQTTLNTSKVSPSPPPKGKVQSAVGLALSLELFQKPGLTQPNVFPDLNIVKGIPNDVLFSNQLVLDIYGGSLDDSKQFNKMAADTVELEQ